MAKTTALSQIIRKAKKLRSEAPNRFNKLAHPWRNGYMAQASAIYAKEHKGKSPVGKPKKKKVAGKKKVKRKKATKKSKPVHRQRPTVVKRKRKRSRKVGTKKPVKTVTRRSVERTVGSKRGRSVGKKDKTMLILGVGALLLGGWYLMSKKATPVYPTLPLQQTSNVTRNNQSNDILNYAIAGGLAIDAITKLIESLNNSSDNQVDSYYKQLNTTGQLDTGLWA